MGVEAKKMMFLNTHMADWQTGRLTPKRRSQSAKSVGNLANLGNVHKYIIINNISLKVAKVAMFLVCSCTLKISYIAKFQRAWQPCQVVWQSTKRGGK